MTFGYEADHPILKDMSFKMEAGKVAALVGPTGAGKSTIIGLIPRFYDPDSGVVKIDGQDVKQFEQKSIRDQVSSCCRIRCSLMLRCGRTSRTGSLRLAARRF